MSVSPIWHTPFLEDRHRALVEKLLAWDIPEVDHDPEDFDLPVRLMLRAMAAEGLLDLIIPAPGKSPMSVDLRAICLVREVLAYRCGGLADTSFVMQGIGTAAIWLSGSEATAGDYLARARRGETIAAFALTEPETGSDVANITTGAIRDGSDYVLDGAKTFISNAGIADHYLIIARTGEAPGARGLSAFLVDAGTPGLTTEKQRYVAAHAGGSLTLHNVRVPASRLIGTPGGGFKLAMATFDIFRASVGAAAIGFGRRALDEALDRTKNRQLFGKRMADKDGVQTKLAEMATEIEAAGLLVYRAAWAKDNTGQRCTREVSMAKLVATESAQNVIDAAVQLFGGAGVTHGSVVERLYREVRPMRIYEGASEVQKLVIAREILKD
jgi:acyl-CoA dehydrogenase